MRNQLDAHEKPPDAIKNVYKTIHKLSPLELDNYQHLIDCNEDLAQKSDLIPPSKTLKLPSELQQIFEDFLQDRQPGTESDLDFTPNHTRILEVTSIPGLFIYPSLLPPQVQLHLLDKLLHRDLSNPAHQTNIHTHYRVPYPPPSSSSYFSLPATSLTFTPKSPTLHRPLTTTSFLTRKLRWLTLGGQYDWTSKLYPSTPPPPFPSDIGRLISSLFPTRAEAAIINLYSPGDTLSLHRDVSEASAAPLLSISLGCEGVFVVGLDGKDEKGRERVVAVRLRSGDAVVMGGKARFAWHGVPRVLEASCPEWMGDWPAGASARGGGEGFEEWRGWMRGKRVNVNVRQMFE